jgi:hypothetical protein
MTAEEILEKHLLLMLKRTDESYVSVDEMKKQPEWQATINAMLEYSKMQALRIHDVVGRSEQLCQHKYQDIRYGTSRCVICGKEEQSF